MKRQIISFPELRLKYHNETSKDWINNDGIINDDYVTWLENKLLDIGIWYDNELGVNKQLPKKKA